MLCLLNLPLGAPQLGAPEEEIEVYRFSQFLFIVSAAFALFFGLIVVLTFLFKRRSLVSYDYVFVSGELRIAKIFNASNRKHILCLKSDQILQIGDVESSSYASLENDFLTKKLVLTPNVTPTKGKFFMYISADDGTGKKLYVLECKEELLINILKFIGRGKLASDYVMQAKK